MRRRRLLLTACALAATVMVAPASAQCPSGDGTLPGSDSSVTAVGTGDATPYTTVYVDDRDWADLDDDGNAQGIWIYIESNGEPGLQRGGQHVSASYLPTLPRIGPTQVVPPHPGGLPILPNGITLFPGGFPPPCTWGYTTCVPLLPYDDCNTDQSGQPRTGEGDSILF